MFCAEWDRVVWHSTHINLSWVCAMLTLATVELIHFAASEPAAALWVRAVALVVAAVAPAVYVQSLCEGSADRPGALLASIGLCVVCAALLVITGIAMFHTHDDALGGFVAACAYFVVSLEHLLAKWHGGGGSPSQPPRSRATAPSKPLTNARLSNISLQF